MRERERERKSIERRSTKVKEVKKGDWRWRRGRVGPTRNANCEGENEEFFILLSQMKSLNKTKHYSFFVRGSLYHTLFKIKITCVFFRSFFLFLSAFWLQLFDGFNWMTFIFKWWKKTGKENWNKRRPKQCVLLQRIQSISSMPYVALSSSQYIKKISTNSLLYTISIRRYSKLNLIYET